MGYCFGISTVGWYALSTGWLDFIEDNELRANSYYFGDCLVEPLPYACATETGGEFAYTRDGLLKEEFLDATTRVVLLKD
jgi:hypothetical protein